MGKFAIIVKSVAVGGQVIGTVFINTGGGKTMQGAGAKTSIEQPPNPQRAACLKSQDFNPKGKRGSLDLDRAFSIKGRGQR